MIDPTNGSRWMDDMQFYVPFNCISVISGQWKVDNDRLCAMEHCLRLRRLKILPRAGIKLGPLDQ